MHITSLSGPSNAISATKLGPFSPLYTNELRADNLPWNHKRILLLIRRITRLLRLGRILIRSLSSQKHSTSKDERRIGARHNSQMPDKVSGFAQVKNNFINGHPNIFGCVLAVLLTIGTDRG